MNWKGLAHVECFTCSVVWFIEMSSGFECNTTSLDFILHQDTSKTWKLSEHNFPWILSVREYDEGVIVELMSWKLRSLLWFI